MPTMITKTGHRFADVDMRKGDQYEATEDEALLIQTLGWAELKKNPTPEEYQTAAIKSADSAPDQPRQKRSYRRRDMRAES